MTFNEDDLEERLRRAMQPVDAPAGFTDRVMAKVAGSPLQVQDPFRHNSIRRFSMGHQPAWRWAWGAVAAMLLFGTGYGVERVHRQEQTRDAERQLMVAMQTTAHALDDSQKQLNRAGVRFSDAGKD